MAACPHRPVRGRLLQSAGSTVPPALTKAHARSARLSHQPRITTRRRRLPENALLATGQLHGFLPPVVSSINAPA